MKHLLCVAFTVLALTESQSPLLLLSETFDTFNLTRWNHMVTARGYNEELEYYRNNRKNSFVQDGKLHIRPTFTADEYGEDFLRNGTLVEGDCNLEPCKLTGSEREFVAPILSARIHTKGSFSFKYGRLEVRAKMPRGDWIWPAIWLLPEGEAYGAWPRNGEIDLVEVRANSNLTDSEGAVRGVQRVTSALHFTPGSPRHDRYYLLPWTTVLSKGDFSDDFHNFTLDWSSTSLAVGIDGEVYGRTDLPEGGFWEFGGFDKNPGGENIWSNGDRVAPFDQKFYIVLNVAVGGRFFPDKWVSGGQQRPWVWNGAAGPKRQFWEARPQWQPTWDRPEMIVDHIYVWSA